MMANSVAAVAAVAVMSSGDDDRILRCSISGSGTCQCKLRLSKGTG
jgi:hypothetical protein